MEIWQGSVRVGNVSLDRAHYTVQISDYEITLTSTEFEFMATLTSQPDRIFTHAIIERRTGEAFGNYGPATDSYIHNLRHKLEPDELIFTVHGAGYKFEAEIQ